MANLGRSRGIVAGHRHGPGHDQSPKDPLYVSLWDSPRLWYAQDLESPPAGGCQMFSQSSKGQENQEGPGSVVLRSGVGTVGVYDPPDGAVYGLFFHSTNMYSGAGNTARKRIL